MKKMNIHIGLCLIVCLLPDLVLGENAKEEFFRIERSKKNNVDLRISSVGGFGLNKGTVGHIDLSYIESVDNGDALVLDLGGGVSVRAGVTFFLGMGFSLGYNWDNSDYISAYYPEIGMVAQLTKTFGVIATGRRYSNLYHSADDENIVMLGLLFSSYQ